MLVSPLYWVDLLPIKFVDKQIIGRNENVYCAVTKSCALFIENFHDIQENEREQLHQNQAFTARNVTCNYRENISSYSLCSILVSRKVLELGSRWQVGNGARIIIWEDHCMRRPHLFRPLLPLRSPTTLLSSGSNVSP